MDRKLYQVLASLIEARQNCIESGNTEWRDRHEQRADALVKEHMPSGSGFDAGTTLDWDESNADKLVFHADYHGMDENGMYCGWTAHKVIVRPSLTSGYYLRITGPNRNQFKDCAYDVFSYSLDIHVERA